ncbi:MAG: hypothetical protein CUN49_03435 [Candidatus Thermofonsia Clade 1 bacterium]|jgi:hypothetical protein|uniref:Uncharacterized protein n=1 Tax=Candidatus Thermofonsia Clade 1 bacterium TaxID=2364210 RepID=A0A2M8PGZ1_9CHLR|nr:MAG: hypothetical protein CUN49_03435 [Candidatus Thermofonsia Clade 1 bacterium]RMF51213.1 MAG: hypothetical protein D6749_08450 [Chloroflexota bacterium]
MTKRRKASKKDAPKVDRLMRFALWLGKRRRTTRIALASLNALILTAVIALALFNSFFRIRADQINLAVANALLFGTAILGLALYWLGWRLLVGFDFGERPLQVGKAGALYVLLSALIGIGALIWSLLALAEALSAP